MTCMDQAARKMIGGLTIMSLIISVLFIMAFMEAKVAIILLQLFLVASLAVWIDPHLVCENARYCQGDAMENPWLRQS
ncbi:hypothetical protein ACH51_22420 (plasmid) [Ralstonia solanacearum]|nr:hypothetical protein ACH51_22420 [Ralstonia solanacearum]